MPRLVRIVILALLSLVLAAEGAHAQSYRGTVPSTAATSTTTTTGGGGTTSTDVGVLPSVTTQVPPGETSTVPGGAVVRDRDTPRRALSRTGNDVLAPVLVAAGLVACGTLVSVAARRRRRNAFI